MLELSATTTAIYQTYASMLLLCFALRSRINQKMIIIVHSGFVLFTVLLSLASFICLGWGEYFRSITLKYTVCFISCGIQYVYMYSAILTNLKYRQYYLQSLTHSRTSVSCNSPLSSGKKTQNTQKSPMCLATERETDRQRGKNYVSVKMQVVLVG